MSSLRFFDFFKQSIFWGIHVACLAVIWVGISWVAVAVCIALYLLRMFAITGGYHRYFSHRTYETSRFFQFVLGFLGATAAQKGPLWWASHHRHHHQHSDTEDDVHPPSKGFWWSHVGWVISAQYNETNLSLVRDLAKYPELRWLDRNHAYAPIILAVVVFFFGSTLQYVAPSLNTSGWQMLVWGFFVSTTLLYHGTFTINSLTHRYGRRRFDTTDHSRNNFLFALVTLGEGWHNNHHRYPGSERQGFYWWEIDLAHYALKLLSWLGIVWNLRVPPKRIYDEAEERKERLKHQES